MAGPADCTVAASIAPVQGLQGACRPLVQAVGASVDKLPQAAAKCRQSTRVGRPSCCSF